MFSRLELELQLRYLIVGKLRGFIITRKTKKNGVFLQMKPTLCYVNKIVFQVDTPSQCTEYLYLIKIKKTSEIYRMPYQFIISYQMRNKKVI